MSKKINKILVEIFGWIGIVCWFCAIWTTLSLQLFLTGILFFIMGFLVYGDVKNV